MVTPMDIDEAVVPEDEQELEAITEDSLREVSHVVLMTLARTLVQRMPPEERKVFFEEALENCLASLEQIDCPAQSEETIRRYFSEVRACLQKPSAG